MNRLKEGQEYFNKKLSEYKLRGSFEYDWNILEQHFVVGVKLNNKYGSVYVTQEELIRDPETVKRYIDRIISMENDEEQYSEAHIRETREEVDRIPPCIGHEVRSSQSLVGQEFNEDRMDEGMLKD